MKTGERSDLDLTQHIRRRYLTGNRRNFLTAGCALAATSLQSATATETTPEQPPLDFSFITEPPGRMHPLGTHRLHSWCLGEGDVTVLLEPGLGGSALEWLPLAEQISKTTQVCLYDRAGYGWSDPGIAPRHIVRLASEAQALLSSMNQHNPVILVGHSYGGLIMRELAQRISQPVLGLVLVDASHEEQFKRLSKRDGISMLPTSRHFVVSAPELPAGLRPDIRRKIEAFSRMRKIYAALHDEIASFQQSCTYLQENRHQFDFPVTVISRGKELYNDENASVNNSIWNELQTDLLSLSDQSQRLIAKDSGHHIHIDQPQYVLDAVLDILT